MNNFKENLKRLRKMKGLSQQQLADDLGRFSLERFGEDYGFTRVAVNSWESGVEPSVNKRNVICEYFGVTMDYMINNIDTDIVFKSTGTQIDMNEVLKYCQESLEFSKESLQFNKETLEHTKESLQFSNAALEVFKDELKNKNQLINRFMNDLHPEGSGSR